MKLPLQLEYIKPLPEVLEINSIIPYANIQPIDEYQKPINPETNAMLPDCCAYHKLVLDEARKFYEAFPDCCANHRKLKENPHFNKSDFNSLPEKMV